MNPKPQTDSRLAAVETLGQVLDHRRALSDVESFATAVDSRDAAFARRLAYGVLRWYGALDWLANHMLDHPLKPRDADIHRLVLMGVYQLWKENIAPHAAVHATAGCATRLGKKWAVSLINALLRRFQREQEELLNLLAARDERHAHPPWLLECLRQEWPEDWEAIVEVNNQQPPMWLRCNLRRASVADLRPEWMAAGFEVQSSVLAEGAVALMPPAAVEAIPGFADGRVSVQDLAAQFAAPLLAPQAGERVLDACAAPGGKSCHLLELEPGIELTSLDLRPARTSLIQNNLTRLGLQARVVTGDATRPGDWWDQRPFHKILLDAPCSATGVIRRHPEIKWLRSPDQVREAEQLQHKLLESLWPLLDAGGMLVYATCSVIQRENSRQIEAFLDRHPDAQCSGTDQLPGTPQTAGCQILPGQEDMDGFYYAVLRKSD